MDHAEAMHAMMPDLHDLEILLRSDTPIVLIRSIDELFFVDLPAAPVRREIFAIQLSRRGLDPERFDLARLAEASEDFTGAGIEQAVVSALYADETAREGMTTGDLLREIANTQPLYVVMHGPLQALRAWALGRTVQAHAPEEQDDSLAIARNPAAGMVSGTMDPAAASVDAQPLGCLD
ncbi:hypothetical protein [Thiocapsa sp.]|uniref:hypothetical protein n=1 Tax=Thiocapsa sp. TaxID=2024551 RepID=UPI002B93AC17|nr:hypothetical protein [Thiocapsa sp.]HSO83744.1 hypothetical protein [Thiocapsa sp.]